MLSKEVKDTIDASVMGMIDIEADYKDVVISNVERSLDLVEYILQDYNKNIHIDRVTTVGFKTIDIHAKYVDDGRYHECYVPVDIKSLSEVTTIYRISQSIIHNIVQYLFNEKGDEYDE